MAVGLSSVGSFTSSFTRLYGISPTGYRARFPPAAAYALVPACVLHAFTRPQNRRFGEDDAAVASIPSSGQPSSTEPEETDDDQDWQRAGVGA